MKTSILLLLCLLLPFDSFKQEQLRFQRVRKAFSEKGETVKQWMEKIEIRTDNLQLYLRAFKKEQLLEVWGKNAQEKGFCLLHTFEFCTTSGELGPKKMEGDYQIPEGFYHIDRFNPSSNFYLSLGINYPNTSDKKRAKAGSLGGDIFIHGSCVTVGCIPITDAGIMELYVLAVEAKNNGQEKIPVHIFPTRLAETDLQELKKAAWQQEKHVTFWESLQPAYLYFERYREIPKVTVTPEGAYQLIE